MALINTRFELDKLYLEYAKMVVHLHHIGV